MIDVTAFMIKNNVPTIDAMPNLWFTKLDERQSIDEKRNGNAIVVNATAKVGSGLNLKCAVSENGNERE